MNSPRFDIAAAQERVMSEVAWLISDYKTARDDFAHGDEGMAGESLQDIEEALKWLYDLRLLVARDYMAAMGTRLEKEETCPN